MDEIKRKISDLVSDSPGLLLPILMPLFLIFIMSALFFMPLYGIISGRIYKECFRTPECYEKLENKFCFIAIMLFCFFAVYSGTIGIGEELCNAFNWPDKRKFLIAGILFCVYLSFAMSFNNSSLKKEIKAKEKFEEERRRKTEKIEEYINTSKKHITK